MWVPLDCLFWASDIIQEAMWAGLVERTPKIVIEWGD